MKKSLGEIEPLRADSAEISVAGSVVRFGGSISMRSPSEVITPYLRRVHDAAIADSVGEITVDLENLRFMNSSSIRSLVDWVEWIRREPESNRYALRFVTKRDAAWQTTTLAAIQRFGGEHVSVVRSA